MNKERLLNSLKEHEGLRLKPYVDTTGNITIGYGLNLSAGITEFEAEWLLEQRTQKAIYSAEKAIEFFHSLSSARQEVIVEMIYNLGLSGFLTFKNFIKNIENNDFILAAKELVWNKDGTRTKWARQVGKRADFLADKFKNG